MKKPDTKIIVVCGTLIIKNNKLVIVQEAKKCAWEKWNIPAGHLDPDENLLDAAKREAEEECGLNIKLDGVIGIYQHKSTYTGNNIVKIFFKGHPVSGSLKFPKDEILDAKWITFDEFKKIPLKILRTADLKQLIKDYRTKKLLPLNVIKITGL